MDIKEINPLLKELYRQITKANAVSVTRLPLSGSNRVYFRVEGEQGSVIATHNEDKSENYAFLYLADHLRKHGVNVPEVYYKDIGKGIYLQQDLGNISLFEIVTDKSTSTDKIFDYYCKVIDQMPVLQYKSAQDLDFSICYPRESFGRQSMQWDLNYFKYFFLKTAYIPFHEQKLEDEFQKLIDFLKQASSNFFLFRDFQSRNIMWYKNEPYFIDFQGGRRGALQYDLASLLFESKTSLTSEMRHSLLEYYIKVFSQYAFFKADEFLKFYPAYALIRLLQAFGAYGYRGLFEKKAFFVQSISPATDSLQWVVEQEFIKAAFPYLCEIINSIVLAKDRFVQPHITDELTVTITSFSYRIGIPDDWTGNGGGFVFDCRALPNPGQYEEYKLFSGRDKQVIDFLEKETDVKEFVNRICPIVGASVKKYIEKGYNHLSVSFGCTGGRHRSVYCAEQLFNFLKSNYNINLRLVHRELNLAQDHNIEFKM